MYQATAEESPQTLSLVGHKPTITKIELLPTAPKAGETVTVSWKYSDIESDPEGESIVVWYIAGNEVKGGTGRSYTLPKDSGNKKFEVVVQPMSKPPAMPNQGDRVSSGTIPIGYNASVVEGTTKIVFGKPSTIEVNKYAGHPVVRSSQLSAEFKTISGLTFDPTWHYFVWRRHTPNQDPAKGKIVAEGRGFNTYDPQPSDQGYSFVVEVESYDDYLKRVKP
ncbi:MAG: hypothetical protein ACRDA8_13020 [Shewanella sp.]